MIRYNLMKVVKEENDITFYDLLSIDWNKFIFPSGYLKHIITTFEVYKFYMISYKYYRTTLYEDFLLKCNKIANPFDLRSGIEIKIPYLQDIKTFLLENKK